MKKCGLFKGHDWDKYGELLDSFEGYSKQQSRKCKVCGKIEVRSFTIKGQTSAKLFNDSMKELK